MQHTMFFIKKLYPSGSRKRLFYIEPQSPGGTERSSVSDPPAHLIPLQAPAQAACVHVRFFQNAWLKPPHWRFLSGNVRHFVDCTIWTTPLVLKNLLGSRNQRASKKREANTFALEAETCWHFKFWKHTQVPASKTSLLNCYWNHPSPGGHWMWNGQFTV